VDDKDDDEWDKDEGAVFSFMKGERLYSSLLGHQISSP